MTHTVCTSRIVEGLNAHLVSPVREWDAVVCTSRAVREALERTIEMCAEELARDGVRGLTHRPATPVIPLGVDCTHYAALAKRREEGAKGQVRARLGIGEEDFVATFVGRLCPLTKAFPSATLAAMGRTARRIRPRRAHLVLAGQFPSEKSRAMWRTLAASGAGAAVVHVMRECTGPRSPGVSAALGAADVFVSLADNIQESFGLTPLEAMASGLPVIASDWNGYRDTVEDGVCGHLVRTIIPSRAAGEACALRRLEGESYERSVGSAALLTCVDVASAATALEELARAPERARAMGARAALRARKHFDWPVVMRRYRALWRTLEQRRRRAKAAGRGARREAPQAPNPFAVYAGFASTQMDGRTRVRRDPQASAHALARARVHAIHRIADALVGGPERVAEIESALSGRWETMEEIAARSRGSEEEAQRAVAYLAKLGIAQIEETGP